jgi:hypothetical protein
VSVEWYTRLEQGRVGAPGAAVLDALAAALRLSEPQRCHLHLIARGEAPVHRHEPAPVSDSLRALLDGLPLLPAYVIDLRFDVLAHNAAAAALFGAAFGQGPAANTARQLFVDAGLRETQLTVTPATAADERALRALIGRHSRSLVA